MCYNVQQGWTVDGYGNADQVDFLRFLLEISSIQLCLLLHTDRCTCLDIALFYCYQVHELIDKQKVGFIGLQELNTDTLFNGNQDLLSFLVSSLNAYTYMDLPSYTQGDGV